MAKEDGSVSTQSTDNEEKKSAALGSEPAPSPAASAPDPENGATEFPELSEVATEPVDAAMAPSEAQGPRKDNHGSGKHAKNTGGASKSAARAASQVEAQAREAKAKVETAAEAKVVDQTESGWHSPVPVLAAKAQAKVAISDDGWGEAVPSGKPAGEGEAGTLDSEAAQKMRQAIAEGMSQSEVRPAPSIAELEAVYTKSQQNRGQPMVLSWRIMEDMPTYLLTVTSGTGSDPATWILHAGDYADAAVVWISMTADVKKIYSMLKKAMNESGSHQFLSDPARTTSGHSKPPTSANEPSPLDAPATAVLTRGMIFANNFEILSLVGQGGMGMVYKAQRQDNAELVALKVLHPHLVSDKVSKARFEQEAENAKRLSHRNLINVQQFGFTESGQPYLAMDFLEGRPFTDVIKKQQLSLESFISIFTQICEGLHHAHVKGVVHRDIKPSNVIICPGEHNSSVVKIVDFGIAKMHISGTGSQLTPTGEVLGSPSYMSPEQCGGGNTDPRSDIYSLGCVMYEAVSGRVPFDNPSSIKVILMQLSELPVKLSKACPDRHVPMDQERIIMKALEKDPSRRYQTAEELGHDLWKLTILAGSGAVRAFGGDLRRPGSEPSPVQPMEALGSRNQQMSLAPNTSDIVDALKSVGKPKTKVTIRFRKMKQPLEKEVILHALALCGRMMRKGADLSVFLDCEAVHLAQRHDLLPPEICPDLGTAEKIMNIQSNLRKVLEHGGSVVASERWARFMGTLAGGPMSLLDGVQVLNEDQLAEYIIDRSGSVLDYT